MRAIAYVTIDFENMTACPSENDTQMKNCLWLAIDDGSYKTDQDYARYESKLKIWNRIRSVAEVSGDQDGWNFIANAAILRNCIK